MRLMNGGELLVRSLLRHGVKHVFSIIGGQMGTIFDAIGKTPDIEVITPRCETSAALMACGYTASTGTPSAVMATVGAGVVYEVPGLSKAWFSCIPVMSIAPQVQSYRVKPHQESLQAFNQDEMFYPLTKWNTVVFHTGRIPQMVDRGFREAFSGVPGPVHMDIPVDVLFKHRFLTGRRDERIGPPGGTRYRGAIRGSEPEVSEACAMIAQSERPLLIMGQGFGRAGRFRKTTEILRGMGLPVVTTLLSTGTLPGDSDCWAGDIGLYLEEGGLDLLGESDLLVMAGIDRYSKGALEAIEGSFGPRRTVQIEVEPRALLPRSTYRRCLYADPESALEAINLHLKDAGFDSAGWGSWRDRFVAAGEAMAAPEAAGRLSPVRLFEMLQRVSTERDIVIADGEASARAATRSTKGLACRDLFIMDGRDIPGAGLPFAIGASIANPRSRVFLVCDKDALFRHVREILPASSMGLDLSVLCIDECDREANAADTAGVLESLGCRVTVIESDADLHEESLTPEPGTLRGLLLKPS